MSDRVVISCPGCENKLGLRKDMLGKQIQCPGCGTYLAASMPAAEPSSGRRRSSGGSSSKSKSKSKRRNPSSAGSSGRSSSSRSKRRTAAAGSHPSKQQRAGRSKGAKRKSRPAPADDELLDDAWGGDDQGYDGTGYDDSSYDDYGDDFAEAGDDLFSDDLYADDDQGESWLDDGGADDWNAPAALPSTPRKRKKSSSGDSKKSAKKKKSAAAEFFTSGSVLVWVTSGMLGGLLSFVMTIAVGYTGAWLLLYVATVLSGAIVGGSIRATSGETEGWGPGLVALAIVIPVIVVGRVGAFYVSPGMSEVFGEVGQEGFITAEEVDRQTSEDGMISDLIDNEIDNDTRWKTEAGVSNDNFYSETWLDESTDIDAIPYSEMYNEKVWVEGQRRWQELDETERADRTEAQRLELMRDGGILDEASMERLVERETTDEAMIVRTADEFRYDDEWRNEVGLTDRQLRAHWERTAGARDPETSTHPLVWEEASRRWSELDDDGKAAKRAEVAQELKDEQATVEEVTDMHGKFRLGAAIVGAIISLLLPFRPLICTFSSMFLAFKLGSRLAS